MDAQQYLARLGLPSSRPRPSAEALAALQLAHLVAVPFENLDVYHRRGVSTDVAASYAKLVERGRGGWCFELNGAFASLLDELGFSVDRASCQVWGAEGWGPPLDHLALVVHLDGERWLADVGFGDCCLSPIRLVDGETGAAPRPVRCLVDDDGFVTRERQLDGTWVDQLRGEWAPRSMADFEPRSRYLQTEPGLAWTAKPFATRALDAIGSRVTLRRHVLRMRTGGGDFVDRPVDDSEWSSLLADHFALVDEPGAGAGTLRPRPELRP